MFLCSEMDDVKSDLLKDYSEIWIQLGLLCKKVQFWCALPLWKWGKFLKTQPFLAKNTHLGVPILHWTMTVGNISWISDFPTNHIQPFHHRCWVSSKSCGARRLTCWHFWTRKQEQHWTRYSHCLNILIYTRLLVLFALHRIITLRTSYDIMPPPNFVRKLNKFKLYKLYQVIQTASWMIGGSPPGMKTSARTASQGRSLLLCSTAL